jgi:hypothetical protein
MPLTKANHQSHLGHSSRILLAEANHIAHSIILYQFSIRYNLVIDLL